MSDNKIISGKSLFTAAGYISLILVFIISQIWGPIAAALTPEQRKLYNQGILYYDYEVATDSCDPNQDLNDIAPGAGEPTGLTFPNLDPETMSAAINKYIENYSDAAGFRSVFTGLGSTFVSGAENSNINPFFIVAIAQKETQLGKPDDYNVRKGNNAFGRTATTSQPNFQGARLWYYWSSPKASIDHTAPENNRPSGDQASYMKDVYGQFLSANNLTGFMEKYAPRFENDTDLYIKQVRERMAAMAKLAGASRGDGGDSAATDPGNESIDACCADEAPSTAPGRNNEEKVWNFLVTEMGLSETQAAGIMGNIQQESGFRTTALNPSSGAYGIIQWYAGRKTKLQNYAKTQGRAVSSIDVQLQFMKIELESSYKTVVLDPIKASSSMAEATRIWLERFEVPCLPGSSACDREMNIRLPNAQEWLGRFGSGQASTEIGGDSGCDPTSGGGASGEKVGDLAWPVPVNYVNSNFEWFTKPHHDHPSSDIPVPSGTDVYSITAGKVLAVNQSGYGSGYGTYVTIESNGALFRYQHGVTRSVKVKVNQNVDAGQLIMKSGNTGFSTGPHLHVSIESGGGNALARSTEHCPQELFKAMKEKRTVDSFKDLPTSGCVGGASLY